MAPESQQPPEIPQHADSPVSVKRGDSTKHGKQEKGLEGLVRKFPLSGASRPKVPVRQNSQEGS